MLVACLSWQENVNISAVSIKPSTLHSNILIFKFNEVVFLLFLRERPKYQPPVEEENSTVSRGIGEGSDTVKVKRDTRVEETVRARWVGIFPSLACDLDEFMT